MTSLRFQSSGSKIEFYLTAAGRPVSLICGTSNSVDDCDFHDVKGIKALKFRVDPVILETSIEGEASSACRGTTSARHATGFAAATTTDGPTCDWLMRQKGVMNLEVARKAPFALTLGYLGDTQSGIREAVSITEVGSSTETYFTEENDGISVYFDPITGRALKGLEYLQANFYVEKTLLSSLRYGNIFTADTDNSDTFVWPCARLRIEPVARRRGASPLLLQMRR